MHPHAGSAPHVESLVLHTTEAPRVRPSQGQAKASNTRATLRALGYWCTTVRPSQGQA